MKPLHWIIIVSVVALATVAVTAHGRACRYRSELSAVIPQGRQVMKKVLAAAGDASGEREYSEGLTAGVYRFEAGYKGEDEAALRRVIEEVDRAKFALGLDSSHDSESWFGFVPYSSMRTWRLRLRQSSSSVMVTLTWK